MVGGINTANACIIWNGKRNKATKFGFGFGFGFGFFFLDEDEDDETR